jgi:exonuclease III
MRVATWNAQTGLTNNWEALEALRADVITVQECGIDTAAEAEARSGWTCAYKPGRWGRGLAVLASSPFAIEVEEDAEPFVVSTIIDGPRRFRFVGFWAMTEKDVGYTYTRQATRMIAGLPADELDTVVAGDFNASKSSQHLANVASLADRGLVSAYHAYHDVGHDETEAYPTSFHKWSLSRPFHMDFVFVPTHWGIESVDLGTFEDYLGKKLSDHTPIVVSILDSV